MSDEFHPGRIPERLTIFDWVRRNVGFGHEEILAPKEEDRSRGIPTFKLETTNGGDRPTPMFYFADQPSVEGIDHRREQWRRYLRFNPNERWPAAVDWKAEEWSGGAKATVTFVSMATLQSVSVGGVCGCPYCVALRIMNSPDDR